jgi:hypothetical protein
MQPQTKPIAAAFADETKLDVVIMTVPGRPFPEIDDSQPTIAASQLIRSADRYDLTRGVPHSALHD